MPSRSRRAAAEINRYKSLWEQSERECRMWRNRYLEQTGLQSLLVAFTSEEVVLSRDDLIKALLACGRTDGCAGKDCPMFTPFRMNCCNDIRLLAAYMLRFNLTGLTQEEIEEVLNDGNT